MRTIRSARCMLRLRMQEELKRYPTRLAPRRNGRLKLASARTPAKWSCDRSPLAKAHTEYTPIGHTDESRIADAGGSANRLDRDR